MRSERGIRWSKESDKNDTNIPEDVHEQNGYRNDPKFSDRYAWANSADPAQTAPRSGSTLFAIASASFGHITLW